MVKSNIKSWTDHKHFALFDSQMYKSMSAQVRRSMVQRIWGLCTITLRIRDECADNIVLKNPHYDGKNVA